MNTTAKDTVVKTSATKQAPQIGMVSLGCPKALVDSERIMTHLRSEGYVFSNDYNGADVVIVNTCGFLDSARDESLEAIGEAMKANGKVIVTGCLGAEPEKITEKYPHVLSISGPQKYESVIDAVHKAVPPVHDPYVDIVPQGGIKLTPRHYAYLKISEGCNNRCTFCIIPALRGDLVSRPINHVMIEAENLVKAGVKELLVISQDTSAYGVDVKYQAKKWRDKEYRTKFYDLCEALSTLETPQGERVWSRMHYVYPYPHVDEVIPMMRDGLILPYLDIPFQHASPNVLRAMRRPAHIEKTASRIQKWRDVCPDLALRSTFIVGFPGETDEDFQYLLDWMDEVQLDRVGCFEYEDVQGAQSNALEGQVPADVKSERWHAFMAKQQEISQKKMDARIGQTLQILVDEVGFDEDGNAVAIGHSQYDAPEIDGKVQIDLAQGEAADVGSFVNVEITEAGDYDLFGRLAK